MAMRGCERILRVFVFLCALLISISAVQNTDVCKDADVTLNKLWNLLNNIKHGDVLFINIKNYYCPACTRYIDIWKKVENGVLNLEKNVSLFVFDCSCHLFASYCRYFDVRYFPTFRLLHPVYDMIENEKEYKYVIPRNAIAGKTYTGELLLAYREVGRVENIIEFQQLMQTYLCKNVNFNYIDLKSCYHDLSYINSNTMNNIVQPRTTNDAGVGVGNEKEDRNLSVDRWKLNNTNREDIKHDLIMGLLFTLKRHISLGLDVNSSTVEPFLVMLEIVSRIYTDLELPISELSQKIKAFKYPVKYENWVKFVSNEGSGGGSDEIGGSKYTVKIGQYSIDDSDALKFKICEDNSVLCTYWLLYHKISIYCLLHDKENYNFYVQTITNYTKNYLNCENCIQHFLDAQKSCSHGFCNIHSAESVVIFLWRIHNSVTLRSMYENIMVDAQVESTNNSKKQSFLNKDIAFPSELQCKYCRSAIGFTKITTDIANKLVKDKFHSDQQFDAIDAFSVKHVLNYMVRIYS
ncbi:conserved Plasmodium protein, unknown function [Plasmodium ovale curtisi]|uniref:Sulfhydryl oxidase n=2 Tax=Plasmodium ovale TaxID=36330 RepID=A0A1A8WAX7_PLAOA|nr:conserved Plasmodium protein, unknown function [Plasmodium ovale curtisi]